MSLFFTPPDRCLHLGTFPSPRSVQIHIGGAPKFMQNLRVLFLSDVHLRRNVSDDKLNALMDQITAQNADLILMGGDYAETPDQCLRFFEAFGRIRPAMGVYAVPGNNDDQSMPTLRETMHKAGVTLLCNECARISCGENILEIAGCDDHKYGSPQTRGIFSDEKNIYRILISHFPSMPDCSCDLMLSGHTHAGQINVLGLTPYTILFERHYHLLGVRGLHHMEGMQLLVGNGIGVSRLPLRIGAEPQIYLLNFGSKDFC